MSIFAELCERCVSEYRRPRIKDIWLYRTEPRSALKRILPMRGGRLASAAVTPGDIRRLDIARLHRLKPKFGRVQHLRLPIALLRHFLQRKAKSPKTDEGLV